MRKNTKIKKMKLKKWRITGKEKYLKKMVYYQTQMKIQLKMAFLYKTKKEKLEESKRLKTKMTNKTNKIKKKKI